MIIASIILDREREKAATKAAREATIKATRETRRETRREAYKLFNDQNKAYYARMRATLDAGEDFNELPPQFSEDDD